MGTHLQSLKSNLQKLSFTATFLIIKWPSERRKSESSVNTVLDMVPLSVNSSSVWKSPSTPDTPTPTLAPDPEAILRRHLGLQEDRCQDRRRRLHARDRHRQDRQVRPEATPSTAVHLSWTQSLFSRL